MTNKDFALEIMSCVKEAQNKKASLLASTEEQVQESLQEFVNHKVYYCDWLRAQIECIDNIIKTGRMDSAFRALGAPVISALVTFKDGLLEIFNNLKELTDVDEYKKVGIHAFDVLTDFYEAIMLILA